MLNLVNNIILTDINNSPDLFFSMTGQHGFSFWSVLPSSITVDQTLFDFWSTSNNSSIKIVYRNDNKIHTITSPPTGISSFDYSGTSTYLPGNLIQYTVSSNGGNATVFINNTSNNGVPLVGTVPGVMTNVSIGANRDCSEKFLGKIFSIGIHSNVYTAGELSLLYNSGVPINPLFLATSPKCSFLFKDSLSSDVLGTGVLTSLMSPRFSSHLQYVSVSGFPYDTSYWNSGLIAHYPLQDNTGTTTIQEIIGSTTGTIVGGEYSSGMYTYGPGGRLQGSLTFDSNDYIDIPQISFTGAWTASAFMRRIVNGYGLIFGHSTDNTFAGYTAAGTTFQTRMINGGTAASVAHAISEPVWHHLVVGRNTGNNAFLYIDAIPKAISLSATGTVSINRLTADSTQRLRGEICGVRFYNRALSAPEVTGLLKYELLDNTWASPSIQNIPTVKNLGALGNNLRNTDILWIGDSFGWESIARIPVYITNEFARLSNVGIKKIMIAPKCVQNLTHVNYDSNDGFVMYTDFSGSSLSGNIINRVGAGLDKNYSYENNHNPYYMALPSVWATEAFTANPLNTSGLVTINVSNLDDCPIFTPTDSFYSWFNPNDEVELKINVYHSSVAPLSGIKLLDNYSGGLDVDMTGFTSHIVNTLPAIVLKNNDSFNNKTCNIMMRGSLVDNSSKYFSLFNCIANNISRPTGIGFGILADGSWSWDDIDNNTSSIAGEKTYSDAEIEPLLSAFKDDGRKLVIAFCFATEMNPGISDQQLKITNAISAFDRRFNNLGITDYSYLVVTHHMHSGGTTTPYDNRRVLEDSVIATDNVCNNDPRVCHLSLYLSTSGAAFYSDSTGVRNTLGGPQNLWLSGYDVTYNTNYINTATRVMVDSVFLHPSSTGAAEAMGEILANNAYITVSPVTNNTTPSVNGNNIINQTLFVNTGIWQNGSLYSVQWIRSDSNTGTNLTNIDGATGLSYTLGSADLNKYLSVKVTVDNLFYSSGLLSPYSSEIGNIHNIVGPYIVNNSGGIDGYDTNGVMSYDIGSYNKIRKELYTDKILITNISGLYSTRFFRP